MFQKLKWLIYCISILMHCSMDLHGQNSIDKEIFEVHNFGWTPSSQNRIVNGMTIGWQYVSFDDHYKNTSYLNGVNLELSAMGILMGSFVTIPVLVRSFNFGKDGIFMRDLKPSIDNLGKSYIDGFSLSVGGLMNVSEMNGVSVNGLCAQAEQLNGLQLTGLFNLNDYVKGVSIGGLFNRAYIVNGVQIGLFNNCHSGNVLQIGLLNQIGKRVLPFVNMNFIK